MVCLEGGRLLYQAMPDAVLQCPDCPIYLLVSFAVTNGDVVMDNPQPLAEPCKATCKHSNIVSLDIAQLAPEGNHIIA